MNKQRLVAFLKDNKYKIIIVVFLLIGFFSRLTLIDVQPNALNVDEASSGYEAWSILNYGIDRNGIRLPVFLIAWGSGQNALYSYIMMPFVKMLGLNTFSVRIPMAVIGCISLIIFYFLLKEIKDEKTAIIGVAFFVICPWHIMKSRWGLESNIFPDMVLWAVYLIVISLKKDKMKLFYASAIILRIDCICIWHILFLLTMLCYSITDNIIKKEKNIMEKCINIF